MQRFAGSLRVGLSAALRAQQVPVLLCVSRGLRSTAQLNMPLVVPSRDKFPVYDDLKQENVHIIEQKRAQHQDIRPLRIGLLNLMPAAVRKKTEVQFYRLLGHTPLQIQPVLIRFDKYLPQSGREHMEVFYERFQTVQTRGLDGMIVTGANLERRPDGSMLPYNEIVYYDEYKEILSWAREHVPSTLYSCLGAQFALGHFYGMQRTMGTTKTFGVYNFPVDHDAIPMLTDGLNDIVAIPHSRWGDVSVEQMEAQPDIRIIMKNTDVGWHLAVGRGGREVYCQGHPEYDRMDLHGEYSRDKANGQGQPANYYPGGDDTRVPLCQWRSDGHIFYRNWVNMIYQKVSKGEPIEVK